jgi:hypothetical protein
MNEPDVVSVVAGRFGRAKGQPWPDSGIVVAYDCGYLLIGQMV